MKTLGLVRAATFGIMFIVLLLSESLQPAAAQRTGALNLRDADLSALIDLVAQVTGRNYIVDPRIEGRITVVSSGEVSSQELYQIFLNVLDINRYTIVEGEGADRIVPLRFARDLLPNTDTQGRGGFETRAIRVEHVSIDELLPLVRPLLPGEAVLSAFPPGRLLIVSDRAVNLSRIERMISRIDQPRHREIETILLDNALAENLVATFESLGLLNPGVSAVADIRSNALLISGPDAFRDQIRALVKDLDRPRGANDVTAVQLRYADANKLATVISQLFTRGATAGAVDSTNSSAAGRVSVVADARTNMLLILAPPDLLPAMIQAVRQLDTRPSQVLIEGLIFEMSVNRFVDLGVQFGALAEDSLVGGIQFSTRSRPGLSSLAASLLAGNVPDPGDGIALGLRRGNVVAFITALARDSTTNILATPAIMTLDNEAAEIVVAQTVPFVTGRFSTVGDDETPENPFQTIQREDVGLTLRVTPQISAADTVRLTIEQEVSNLTTRASAAGGEITTRRAINTNVVVGNGNLILLGGLLQEESFNEFGRVPGLGDIPILGALFRAKSSDNTKRILLLLFRPKIVRSNTVAKRVTERRYNEARAAERDFLRELDPRLPRPMISSLPPLEPPLGAPFSSDSSAAETSGFPPLPPRLLFPVPDR